MDKSTLVRHLMKNAGNRAPSCKTIAAAYGVNERVVRLLVTQINADEIYEITSSQGGGLSVSSGPTNEQHVYDHLIENLSPWIQSNLFNPYNLHAQKLLRTHSRKLSGKWSTPDFTAVCLYKCVHTGYKGTELVTFEVKHATQQLDVTCVYEALAHARASNYTTLLFYVDPANTIYDQGAGHILDEIKIECVRLGVGLVLTRYPTDLNEWHYVIPAKKHLPDARRIDAFIEEAFGDDDKKWLKQHML